jgi:hypothetical protein
MDIDVAFFSGHYLKDIQAIHDFNKRLYSRKSQAIWDSIAVIDELAYYCGDDYQDKMDLINLDPERWGNSYFMQKGEAGKQDVKRNYFISKIERLARYALPDISLMQFMLLDEPMDRT